MSQIKNRKTRDYFSFLYQKAEGDVINSCFYCGRCKICEKFQIYWQEFRKNNIFHKEDVVCWEITFRGKNKYFTIIPRP